MDNTCTGIHGDVVCEHAQNFAIQKRVLKVKALQLAAGETGKFIYIFEAAFRRHIGSESCRYNIDFPSGFQGHVFFVGVKSDSHGSG